MESWHGHIAEGNYNFTSIEVTQVSDGDREPERDGPTLSFDPNQYGDDLQIFDDARDNAQSDDPIDVAQRDDARDLIQMDDAGDETQRGVVAGGSSKKPMKEPKKSKKREDLMVDVMAQYLEIKRKQVEEESALLVGSRNAQEFTITKCIAVLHKMESIQRSERDAAYKVFKIAENRETYITSNVDDEESVFEWLWSEMADLPKRI